MKSIRNWFWRAFIRRAALRQGFIDPVALMSRLRRFAHTSEVGKPLELVRAGIIFHARGLLNTRAIQNNLDWIWPYWVERQFDPSDDAFIPRAFSITHINLTHRNWTAIGLPDCPHYPVVDPRGLMTPQYDGWSIDTWLLGDHGLRLFPSRAADAQQTFDLADAGHLHVTTATRRGDATLSGTAFVEMQDGQPFCRMHVTGAMPESGWLAVVLRPCNPEGISLIDSVSLATDKRAWSVNEKPAVSFDQPVERHFASNYRCGDVLFQLPDGTQETSAECPAGMVTAAALFRMESGVPRDIELRVSLDEGADKSPAPSPSPASWSTALRSAARLTVPDERFQRLYEQALYSLVLLTPNDVFPGPYTYKRFWFRDASFILHALLCAGLQERVKPVLDRYPERQRVTGYFHSQDGEWDSNGEALWILDRYLTLCPGPLPGDWQGAIEKGARWILRKCLRSSSDPRYLGLMPAGFSAEHLGPNDYYYWDNFWSVAGLQAAAHCSTRAGEHDKARWCADAATAYLARIKQSLAESRARLGRPAMPAAPARRLDAGAIGSLVAGYPLNLFPSGDPCLRDTAEYLMRDCFFKGGFFQDMIHSGNNAYLTLHIAQVLLRAGDDRYRALIRQVADSASPTGQWPEAIHPRTGGGCMGDGHHAWASAEWIMIMRNLFVRAEGRTLVLGAGLFPDWLTAGAQLAFGPGLTDFGRITLQIEPGTHNSRVTWEAEWHHPPDRIRLALPGHAPRDTGCEPHGDIVLPRVKEPPCKY
jgi:hypothetical protein